jgi:hypothetical protein
MSGPSIAKCWTFASSKGSGRYQTLLYADGSRSCKHTRSVLMGNADRECLGMHDSHDPAPVVIARPARRAITPFGQFGQMGRRKIQT